MPTLELFSNGVPITGLTDDGNLPLDPSPPDLNRVLLRRVSCLLRVPRIPGAFHTVIDTGAPLTVFPHRFWADRFRWQEGRDYEGLSVAGVGPVLRGQVLSHRYSCRLVRLKVPVELGGSDLRGDRLRLERLVALLADPGGPPFILLGLWGGSLEGRTLTINRRPGSDDLSARLDF